MHPEATGNVLDLLGRLEQALLDESSALAERDVDALADAVAEKRQTLKLIGQEFARSGLDRFLARDRSPESQPAAIEDSVRRTLIERLERCRALNETAGGAIAVLSNDTNAALAILGVSREVNDYGLGGQAAGDRPRRSLAIC